MGVKVSTQPCPACRSAGRDRSGDNLVVYKDGSKHCFSCGYNVSVRGKPTEEPSWMENPNAEAQLDDIKQLPIRELKLRGISVKSARQYGVRVEFDGEGNEVKYYFPLYNQDNTLVGYQAKVARRQGKRQKKDCFRVGNTREALPFGGNMMGSGGKMLIVVEGAEDTLAANDMLLEQGKAWRVVGALGTDQWKRNLPFYEKFSRVLIAFDQDDAGKKAAGDFASALTPGKAFIVRWDGPKDPNALLEANDSRKFFEAIGRAEPHQPDGILTGETVWDAMESYVKPESIDYPEEWEILQDRTDGMRVGEISMWTAGTSVGKTSYIRRLKSHILTNHPDWPVGEIELEEQKEKTWRGLMQFHMHKRWVDMTDAERRQAYEETYGTRRIFTLDHRSRYTRGASLLSKMKHMHYGMGARIIFLDHITLAVNEFGDGQGLAAQDKMMGEFLEFVETTGAHLCLISHLRKTPGGGTSFERGAVPCEDDLKGSGSLKQISFDIIGVSRDKMHEDDYLKNVSTIHVLKCRETGNTGRCDSLYWDSEAQDLVKAVVTPDDAEVGPPAAGEF